MRINCSGPKKGIFVVNKSIQQAAGQQGAEEEGEKRAKQRKLKLEGLRNTSNWLRPGMIPTTGKQLKMKMSLLA